MTNKEIARLLKLTASLLELHDENQFKIRTYTNAVFNIEKQEEALFDKNLNELESFDGIGKGLAQSIIEIQQKGSFSVLDELISKTPEGIRDMIKLKGLGPKKIKVVWKELGIENVDQLLEACKKSQLAKLKGFGTKTQETLKQNLEYIISQRGKALFSDAEKQAVLLLDQLRKAFPLLTIELTGAMRRKLDVVECVEIIVNTLDTDPIISLLQDNDSIQINLKSSGPFALRGSFPELNLKWHIRFSEASKFPCNLMLSTGLGRHLANLTRDGKSMYQHISSNIIVNEQAAYAEFDLPYIEPELREGTFELTYSKENIPPELLNLDDLKGPFHNHSNYSDGENTIRQLAEYCVEEGYEYLGLSDHSKSAFYANGLQEFQVKKQHEEIDQLNQEFAPFKIYKGIESDILNGGSLDYEQDILESFDFIVASIHSNLNMDRNKLAELCQGNSKLRQSICNNDEFWRKRTYEEFKSSDWSGFSQTDTPWMVINYLREAHKIISKIWTYKNLKQLQEAIKKEGGYVDLSGLKKKGILINSADDFPEGLADRLGISVKGIIVNTGETQRSIVLLDGTNMVDDIPRQQPDDSKLSKSIGGALQYIFG